MKKIYYMFFILLIGGLTKTNAQQGYNYTIIKGGGTFEKGYNIGVAFDFNTNYYNSFEIGLNYYKADLKKEEEKPNYENYLLGLTYKLNLTKNMNSNFLLKIGAIGGSDSHNFVVGPNLGFEYQLALTRGLQFIVSNSNYYLFDADYNNWRSELSLGLRISL